MPLRPSWPEPRLQHSLLKSRLSLVLSRRMNLIISAVVHWRLLRPLAIVPIIAPTRVNLVPEPRLRHLLLESRFSLELTRRSATITLELPPNQWQNRPPTWSGARVFATPDTNRSGKQVFPMTICLLSPPRAAQLHNDMIALHAALGDTSAPTSARNTSGRAYAPPPLGP
jgi:hypothetical protein